MIYWDDSRKGGVVAISGHGNKIRVLIRHAPYKV